MLGCPETERLDEMAKKVRTEAETSSALGRRHFYGPPVSGITLNTITPCAACKLLRRRCAEECPFAPYFSRHEPHKFAAVHKVFGARNVSKMLMEVSESQRADAANSLVYEANLRLRDPVYGCMSAISALQQQIQALQEELSAVMAEILKYKYTEAAACSNMIMSSSDLAALVSSGEVQISLESQSLAQPPLPPPSPSPLPPPKPLPSPSVVLSSLSSSSTYSIYAPPQMSHILFRSKYV